MITIPFPQEAYRHCLSRCGITAEDQMEPVHARQIFLDAITDFDHGAISSDGLGSIAGRLLQILLTAGKETRDKALFDALESASELCYLLRRGDCAAFFAALEETRRFSPSA